MKNFRKFIESFDMPNVDYPYDNQEWVEIFEGKSKEDIVKILIDYIEDIKHLFPKDNDFLKECFELAKKWLKSPNSVNDLDVYGRAIAVSRFDSVSQALSHLLYVIHAENRDIILRQAANTIEAVVRNISNERQGATTYKALSHYKTAARGLSNVKPISDIKNKNIFLFDKKEDFYGAIDWIQEHYHDDIIIQDKSGVYFKFYPYEKEGSLSKLIDHIFQDSVMKRQVTRMLNTLINI